MIARIKSHVKNGVRILIDVLALAFVSAATLAPQIAAANEPVPIESPLYDNLIAGSTTVNVFTNGGVIAPQKGWFVLRPGMPLTIQGYAQGTNAGTENITVIIASTCSTTNADLSNRKTFSFPLVSATSPGFITTNIDTGWLGGNKAAVLFSVQNAHASYVRVKLKATQWSSNP